MWVDLAPGWVIIDPMAGKKKDRRGGDVVDVHVRIPEGMHRRIVAAAARNRRKIVAEILVWLERAEKESGA